MYLDAADKKAHESWVVGFGFKPITHEEYTTLSNEFTLVKMALLPSGTRLLAQVPSVTELIKQVTH